MRNNPNTLRAALGLVLAAVTACADISGPVERTADSHPGFDTSIYPGDAAMRAWAVPGSPYEWVGYYLQAPCHRDPSWMGKRPTLEALGWGTAVLYVGQQTFEGQASLASRQTAEGAGNAMVTCSRTLLTAEQGALDAADAVAKTAGEGFPRGSIVFLDVERMETIPTSMRTYFRAWIAGVLRDGRFRPGVYSHLRNAVELRAEAAAEYAAAGAAGEPEFWIAGGSGFSLDRVPTDVGLDFASIWQGVLDTDERWNGVTLHIDVNVASRRSPSAP